MIILEALGRSVRQGKVMQAYILGINKIVCVCDEQIAEIL